MLDICRKYGPTCIVLLCGALVSWAFVSFAYCEGNYDQAANYDPYKNQTIFDTCFARGPIAAAGRLGIFLSHHKEAFFAAITTLATVAIAVFTYTLYSATTEQARLTRKALKVARDEFTSSHRPRIILRDVHLLPTEQGHEIIFMLVNTGGTPATIVESWIIIEFIQPGNPIRNPRSYGHNDLGRIVFAAGEMKDLTYQAPPDVGLHIAFRSAAGAASIDQSKAWHLDFAGAILYSDDAGNCRRSVFRRRWDFNRQAFCRVDDPDQEYAD